MQKPLANRPIAAFSPPQRHFQALLHERCVLHCGGFPADDGTRKQVDDQSHVHETGIDRYEGEVGNPNTVGCAGAEVTDEQVAGSLPSLPGMVLRVLRPRINPVIPSSLIGRSTVCLETSGKPLRRSQAFIFRRPYKISGFGLPSLSKSLRPRNVSIIFAASMARRAGSRVLQAR